MGWVLARLPIVALVAAAIGSVGCDSYYPSTPGGDGVFRVSLALPQSLPSVAPRSFPYAPAVHLFVAPIDDARDDLSRIGVNVEHAPIPVVSADVSPAEFLRHAVERELADAGLALVVREDAANFVLRVRLIRFFVEEGNTYHGEVRAAFELHDASGVVLYGAAVSGEARQWGRSLSEENYREVFTRASLDATKNLLEDARFQAAFGGKGPGAPAAHASGR